MVAYHIEHWTGREKPFVVYKVSRVGRWPFAYDLRSLIGSYDCEDHAEAAVKEMVAKGEPHLKETRHHDEHGARIFYSW